MADPIWPNNVLLRTMEEEILWLRMVLKESHDREKAALERKKAMLEREKATNACGVAARSHEAAARSREVFLQQCVVDPMESIGRILRKFVLPKAPL
jgi:hypothetical protein